MYIVLPYKYTSTYKYVAIKIHQLCKKNYIKHIKRKKGVSNLKVNKKSVHDCVLFIWKKTQCYLQFVFPATSIAYLRGVIEIVKWSKN